tara:strand:+ start:1011 stop:1184 length:174 start_codon:yes stop_codon:yes gene_type:complete
MTWEDILKDLQEESNKKHIRETRELVNDAIMRLTRTGEHKELRMELTRIHDKLENLE